MTAAEQFIAWAKSVGCDVEVTQDDAGYYGYTCLYLTTPDLKLFDVTVTERDEP